MVLHIDPVISEPLNHKVYNFSEGNFKCADFVAVCTKVVPCYIYIIK